KTTTKNLKIVPEGIDSELANNFQKLYARAVFDFEKNRIYAQPSLESLGKTSFTSSIRIPREFE
ncbi:hypothetical protein, partial [Winogradskyella psychrotolerans]|uniref:hypothetical protein n=1 Tax=Winogradskyella psychrotolerans TaxID=1344585 RepID=UPI000593E72B